MIKIQLRKTVLNNKYYTVYELYEIFFFLNVLFILYSCTYVNYISFKIYIFKKKKIILLKLINS